MGKILVQTLNEEIIMLSRQEVTMIEQEESREKLRSRIKINPPETAETVCVRKELFKELLRVYKGVSEFQGHTKEAKKKMENVIKELNNIIH